MLAPSASTGIDPLLSAQVNRWSAAGDVWFATLLSGRFFARQVADVCPQIQNLEVVQTIQRSSGAIQFGGRSVTIALDLIAWSTLEAQSLSSLLNVAITLIGMSPSAPSGPLALATLRSMQVVTEGATIHAESELAEAEVEQTLATVRN